MVTALMFQLAQWRSRLRQAHPDHLRIARGMMRVSAFVLLGKCAGAAKEMAIAYQYGVSNIVDSYQLTYTLVTWLPSTLLAVLSAVLIPVFVNLKSESREHQEQFIGELEGAALLTGGITALGLWLLWPLVLQTMGGKIPVETRIMSHQLMLGMLPCAMLMLTGGIYASQLQARERHINTLLEGVPATVLLMFVLFSGKDESVMPLILGTVIGLALQSLWLRVLTRGEDGERGRIRFSFKSPEWSRTFSAIRILMIGQVAVCLCAPIDQYFMAHLGEGANGTLGYANRVLFLLSSMGAMAAARATLPILSDILDKGDLVRARRTALTWTFVALLGGALCAAVSWLLAPMVIALLFQRGAFTPADTIAVVDAFRWGLLQLPFYFALLVFSQLFASERRFGAMAKVAVLSFVAKIASIGFLVSQFGIAGAQISTALMYASAFGIYMGMLVVRRARDA